MRQFCRLALVCLVIFGTVRGMGSARAQTTCNCTFNVTCPTLSGWTFLYISDYCCYYSKGHLFAEECPEVQVTCESCPVTCPSLPGWTFVSDDGTCCYYEKGQLSALYCPE